MNKLLKYYSVITLLMCVVSCNKPTKIIEFEGIYADDINGREALYNPERGLRLEVATDLVEDKNEPTRALINQSEEYATDSISLVQSYFYLTNLIDEKLTEENINVLETFFKEIENQGKKSVLRFAYERDFMGREAVGATLEQSLAHLDQLKPFLEKYKHLIQVMQAGVIGAWGEWHASVHGLDKSDDAKIAILKKLLEVVPQDRYIQVRVPEYKNLLKSESELYKRLSFHDDMIIIDPHRWDGDMHEGTPFFDQIVKEAPLLPIDGELPWGFWSVNKDSDSPDAGWLVDGHQAARRFYLQHFTSLSAIHNYLELRGREGSEEIVKYSMQVWQETPIDIDFLKKEKMPISSNYFHNQDGTKVNRSVFEYVRDHLGYRLELQELKVDALWSVTSINSLELSLINRGFSTLFNEHDVYFVLVDDENKVLESLSDANVNDWQPYVESQNNKQIATHRIVHEFKLSKDIVAGKYKLGLWIADGAKELKYNNRYAIRCANGDIDWYVSDDKRYGINILTTIEIE